MREVWATVTVTSVKNKLTLLSFVSNKKILFFKFKFSLAYAQIFANSKIKQSFFFFVSTPGFQPASYKSSSFELTQGKSRFHSGATR